VLAHVAHEGRDELGGEVFLEDVVVDPVAHRRADLPPLVGAGDHHGGHLAALAELAGECEAVAVARVFAESEVDEGEVDGAARDDRAGLRERRRFEGLRPGEGGEAAGERVPRALLVVED